MNTGNDVSLQQFVGRARRLYRLLDVEGRHQPNGTNPNRQGFAPDN